MKTFLTMDTKISTKDTKEKISAEGAEMQSTQRKQIVLLLGMKSSLSMTVFLFSMLLMSSQGFGQGEAAGMPAGRTMQKKPMGSPSGAVAEQSTVEGRQLTAITVIDCGKVLDVRTGQLVPGPVIVKGNKIELVGAAGANHMQGATVISLPNATCLPGLIDAHTHVLLQGDITADDYDAQLLKQSNSYRAIVAAATARKELNYGFTTIRDVETEGAGYADVDLETAINRGIVPGPRMQVATRALDVTGAYPLQGYNWEIQVPHGVQFCDGADECRKAVREQTGHGADWIKVYADRSYYVEEDSHPSKSGLGGPPNTVLKDVPTFTLEELKAIVDETHREKKKIASHAMALYGVHNSVEAGVDSIEHGDYISPEDMATMKAKGIWYVPTLFVGEYVAQGRAAAGAPVWVKMVDIAGDTFKRAMQAGIKIAFGTDAGGFDWNINPAKEFAVRVKLGQSPAAAIRSATLDAATLMGMEDRVGSIEAGKLADIVAVPGSPLDDISVMEKVSFVMKDGVVVKR